MSAKEAKARIKINKLLEDAGWRFFDNEFGPANIQVEANVKLSKTQIDALGDNFEKTKNGFVDFLLLDENGKPFIVLEAKSEDYDPLAGKEQARKYAKSQFVKYVILSNGNIHYFWNIYKGSPQVIITFPTYESVKESKALNADPAKLYSEEIAEDYIAVVKEPRYAEAPEYQNEETRAQFLRDRGLRMLRKDQVNALKALQASVREGNQRFLFEMATGTGKTLTSAAVIRLFLRSGNANRVLFLVDRIELENQAKKNFISYLKPDYETVIFKEHTDDWRKADIVVSTVQTLSYNNKFKKVFKPTDFSLIIADESHRSISGNSRAVFEYFIGYKLGLTATPKDYLKNVDADDLIASDPRAWERRQLLDTYKTFGCESGEPTFRYSLIDGVNDPDGPYLVNPTVVDARTDITTQLLADKGYAVISHGDEEDEDAEETYFARDFEKKFFSDETNKIFVKTFMDNAMRDPLTGEIGKGIIKTVDSVVEDESKKIFVFTPERALQLIASFPDLKIDFFFFDEVYKIDEDYCNDELDDSDDEKSKKNKKTNSNPHDFLNEDRGKTFRVALYLLAKSVDEFYLAGPNLNQDRFSKGMKRFLSLNQSTVYKGLHRVTV